MHDLERVLWNIPEWKRNAIVHAHDTAVSNMFDAYKTEMVEEISEVHDVIVNSLGI